MKCNECGKELTNEADCYGHDCEVLVKDAKIMNEEIVVPIYFRRKDNGKIIIDEEGIRDEFDRKLNEVVKNPKKFLEV